MRELATERANSSRFARSVSVVSLNATLPVAFSPNDGANNSTAVSLFKLIAVRCRLRGLILEPTRQLLAYQLVES